VSATAKALLPALVLAGWAGLPIPQTVLSHLTPHLPDWAERWLYNARERTDTAIAETNAKKPKEAIAPADSALRLSGGQPLPRYNAGTARLLAGDAKGAAPLLDEAAASARSASPELAATAAYNLGNARLAAGDATAAVQAYERALRLSPGNADAKWNLELALKQREEENLRAKSPQEGGKPDRGGSRETSQGKGSDNPADQNQGKSQAHDPGRSPQKGLGPPDGQAKREPGRGDAREKGNEPLPGFQNQPDMSAREAAAVLSGVENLERQQRREAAAKLARQRAAQGKDW